MPESVDRYIRRRLETNDLEDAFTADFMAQLASLDEARLARVVAALESGDVEKVLHALPENPGFSVDKTPILDGSNGVSRVI